MTNRDELLKALDLAGTTLDDPSVICWRDLEPSIAADELEHLTDWVNWINQRYRLDHKVVPPCWAQHGCLVEELSALHTYWQACYLEDASPADPVGFHRDLDLALRRLRDWSSRLGCSRIAHRSEFGDC
ncbi:MAG TPA: hypothetical protein VFG33_10705 [Kribbella sp.]|uniref:hypothetical protein n=1 Tax=Kribbella sp. TaxID=1871183 RepID=UPI002D7960F2|nr:hypothetical protein [Kribbella sp.]HET6293840.1 hypothetical protein [Kribbella sp.]